MTKRQTTSKNPAPQARHWFRFGPGLLLALLASAIVWYRMASSGGGPRIERKTVAVPFTPAPSAPDPAWLLEQQKALRLSESQVKKLSRLRMRWDRNTQALREALEHASVAFEQSIPPPDGGRLSLEQLKKQAAPVSELSRQLLEARRAWWSEAATVLTPSQRQQAEQAWSRRLAPKPDRADTL